MVFSSHVFLFYFLPAALGLYYLCPARWRGLLLIGLSYLCYGWANPWFVLLLVFSTVLNYACGEWISGRWRIPGLWRGEPAGRGLPAAGQRKAALGLCIAGNLAFLGFFKYLGFVEANLNALLGVFGRAPVEVYTVALPAGISFYTFKAMSYCLDVYQGASKPARGPVDFACYVALFPQLVAGPIGRFRDLGEQLQRRSQTLERFSQGVFFFALGMLKKVLLADPMGQVADAAFGAASVPWHAAWAGALAYSFQIYFDFSGYSDMATGLGLMMGFEFRRNFDLPYLAQSITEFWRRWHISLQNWLQDFIFMPLTKRLMRTKLRGKGHAIPWIGYMVTFLACGLWHGAAWTFVVWGGLHGLLLCLERLAGRKPIYAGLPQWCRTLATFALVLLTWVFFRAETFGDALSYLSAMFGLTAAAPSAALVPGVVYQPQFLVVFAACLLIHVFRLDTWDLAQDLRPAKLVLAAAAFAASVAMLFTQSYEPFLYFRF